jgi:ATP-dependent RNA helicase DHX37/DHR1
MYESLHTPAAKHSSDFLLDDSFRWFARFLLEGKVFPELKEIQKIYTDSPTIITKKTPVAKVSMLVSALSSAGVDSASALSKHWAEKDDKFLFKCLKSWIKRENHSEGKKIWIEMVKRNVKIWKKREIR